MTVAQRDLRRFLGKKNFKGLNVNNPLARAPGYHKFDKKKVFLTSYPVKPQHQIDRANVDWPSVFSDHNSVSSRQPFPENSYTRSNRLISDQLRQVIVTGHEMGETVQQLSFRLGLSVPRVQATLKLEDVRKQAEKLLAGSQKVSNHNLTLHGMMASRISL